MACECGRLDCELLYTRILYFTFFNSTKRLNRTLDEPGRRRLTVIRRKALYSRKVSCSASSAGWRLLKTSVTRRVAAVEQ